jgi:hypothetical protein
MDDAEAVIWGEEPIQVVILDEPPVTIIETEAQGPPGAVVRLSAVAGEDLPAHRLIRSDVAGKVFLADFSEDVGEIVGTTVTSALVEESVLYVASGIEIPFPGALPGARYYLGENGQFTTNIPADGLLLWAGLCVRSDFILLQPATPVIRRRLWE